MHGAYNVKVTASCLIRGHVFKYNCSCVQHGIKQTARPFPDIFLAIKIPLLLIYDRRTLQVKLSSHLCGLCAS